MNGPVSERVSWGDVPIDDDHGSASRRRLPLTTLMILACMLVFGGGIAGMAFRYVRIPTDQATADGFLVPDGCRVVRYSHDPALGRTTVELQSDDPETYRRLKERTPDFYGRLVEGVSIRTAFSDSNRRLTVTRTVRP